MDKMQHESRVTRKKESAAVMPIFQWFLETIYWPTLFWNRMMAASVRENSSQAASLQSCGQSVAECTTKWTSTTEGVHWLNLHAVDASNANSKVLRRISNLQKSLQGIEETCIHTGGIRGPVRGNSWRRLKQNKTRTKQHLGFFLEGFEGVHPFDYNYERTSNIDSKRHWQVHWFPTSPSQLKIILQTYNV